jgi:hypothetical protein
MHVIPTGPLPLEWAVSVSSSNLRSPANQQVSSPSGLLNNPCSENSPNSPLKREGGRAAVLVIGNPGFLDMQQIV